MSLFVALVEKDEDVKHYAETSHKTLEIDPIAGMWFSNDSYVHYKPRNNDTAWLVGNFDIVFPPLFLHLFATVISWIAVFFFGGFELSWWLALPVVVTITLAWHTKYFFSFMNRLGLRKWGYEGEYKLLNNTSVLNQVFREERQVLDAKQGSGGGGVAG